MFEQEIDLVKKHLLEQLFSSQQYIYIHEILNNPGIDEGYKTFFNAEVAWWIYEEQSLRHSNPRFDIEAPEIRQMLDDLDARYKCVARFDHEELQATVDAVAKARLNFLLRPRTALKWFVFRGEPTKPLHEILMRMEYFSDHIYILNGFKEWSRQRRIDRPMEILSVVEFERIIERIDNEAIFDLSPHQFVDLLAPVFAYFQVPSTRIPVGTLPMEALIIFLDDKGVIPISQTLENLLYNEELRYITKERFLAIVDDIVQDMDESQEVNSDSTLPLDFETTLQPSEKNERFSKKTDPLKREEPVIQGIPEQEESNNKNNEKLYALNEVLKTEETITENKGIHAAEHVEKGESKNEIAADIIARNQLLPIENQSEVLDFTSDANEKEVLTFTVSQEDAPIENIFLNKESHSTEAKPYGGKSDFLNEGHRRNNEEISEGVSKNSLGDDPEMALNEGKSLELPDKVHVDETSENGIDDEEILKENDSVDSEISEDAISDPMESFNTADVLKSIESASDSERIGNSTTGEDRGLKSGNAEVEEPYDSFLEDIHRFKTSEVIVEFEGALPEEIIEQTVLRENIDSGEIPETEKHRQELAEEQTPVTLPPIAGFIDSRLSDKFTKKLFKKNGAEYIRFVNELEKVHEWKEAAKRIDLYFAQNDVAPDAPIAEEFRQIIHKRYGK